MRHADVVVVGGGVVGCAIAWFLARERVSVALLERDDLARHASGVAAGMLTPIAEARAEGPLLRFGLASLADFEALVAELRERTGVDPEHTRSGLLFAARTPAEAEALQVKARELAHLGLAWVAPEVARSREPQLAPDLLGALWSPQEGHVRGGLLTRAYARAAEGLGARLERGTPVIGLLRRRDRVSGVRTAAGDWTAGHVVVASGPWAGEVTGWLGLGLPLPIVPVRGQILELEGPPAPLHTVLWGEGVYLVPRRDGSVTVGATEERVGFDCRVTAEGVRGLLAAAIRLVPALADARLLGAWAGLRPDTPDHLPAIGPLPGVQGLLLAVGHYRKGVLLSPATGRLVTDLVLGKGLPPEARPFLPARWFQGAEPVSS